MAYDHSKYTVRNVEKCTAEYLNRASNTVETVNPDDPKPVIVDNIPLTPQCAAMVAAVREAMPNLKIGLGGSGGDYDTYHKGMNSVIVYREGDVQALGRIGFRDVAISGYKHHYFVFSRKITNQKCNPGRWQYNTKSSEDMGKALKFAKQYLIPYAPQELANISIDDFTRVFERERRESYSRTRMNFRDMVMGDEELLIEEIKRLVATGYQFLKPQFAEKVAAYLSAEGAYKQNTERRLDAYFMDIGPETTTIVEYEDMVDINGQTAMLTKPKDTKVVKTEDIPFDLQLKISSLQVAEPLHYVEDLGMRVGDRTFWVQR